MSTSEYRSVDAEGELPISEAELAETAGAYKQAAGFDRDTLNARPSLAPLAPANRGR